MLKLHRHAGNILLALALASAGALAHPQRASASDAFPPAPLHTPFIAAGASSIDQTSLPTPNRAGPSVPQPNVRNPTEIYNNLILGPSGQDKSRLPASSATAKESVAAKWTGDVVSDVVTNIASGDKLNYHNVPVKDRPKPCVDFDIKKSWASQAGSNGVRTAGPWDDSYAGWASFAVDDGGFYRADNVIFSFDEVTGNGISAKIASVQPYGAWYESPRIPVEKGDEVKVVLRYLLGNIPPELPAAR